MKADKVEAPLKTNPVSTLRDYVLNKVQNRNPRILLKHIAEDTGVPLTWLKGFNRGGTEHPSVVYIQRLYEYFNDEKPLI